MRAGAIDLHYRDYEEPPGNGGFLLNGGRIYLDMGHIEYASPECRQLRDIVGLRSGGRPAAAVRARFVRRGRTRFRSSRTTSITTPGATFGCHENYLMKREAQFTPAGARRAARFSRHPPDFHRRRPGRPGQSPRLRFRSAGGGGDDRFPAQPAGRSHRERHLPVGAVQPRDHQRARRAAGRLSEISPAASADRRLEHEPVCQRAEDRDDGLHSHPPRGGPFA